MCEPVGLAGDVNGVEPSFGVHSFALLVVDVAHPPGVPGCSLFIEFRRAWRAVSLNLKSLPLLSLFSSVVSLPESLTRIEVSNIIHVVFIHPS